MSYPALFTTPGVRQFAEEIDAERQRQLAKFGEQHHPDGTGQYTETIDADVARMACENAAEGGYLDWLHILREEVAEAFAEADPARLRAELVQVAAVCAAWIADIDSRRAGAQQQAEGCGKCKTPFDPTDARFDGHARYAETAYCRRCVDFCHDTEIADHRCVICA
ncbi:hypothetical protein ACFXPN_42565 [Streptomyces griseorubiginosus]|uniref:hypothetical protein n=1 Tax=Streptomyces griseorubiginosus TaxID=67304 RepID=UPI0036803DD6